jgi:hypothetical protein
MYNIKVLYKKGVWSASEASTYIDKVDVLRRMDRYVRLDCPSYLGRIAL